MSDMQEVYEALRIAAKNKDQPTVDRLAAYIESQSNVPVPTMNEASFDTVTGVPKGLRAALGATPKPTDKLNLVKKYFPDAKPYGNDNFVYQNPKTGRMTLVNPKGLDFGDVAEYGRIPAEIFGGAVGTVLGTAGGPPTMVGGGIAGSQIAGEGYDALMRQIYGSEDTRTMTEMAKDVGAGAAIDLATLGLAKTAGPVARKMFGSKTGVEAGQAAKRLGMGPLPTGTVSGRGVARVESAVQQTLGGANAVDNAYAAAIADMQKSLSQIAGQGAGMTTQSAGQSVLDAATAFKNKFQTRSDDLYNKLDLLVPKGQMFEAPSTKTAIDSLLGGGIDSEQLAKMLAPKGTVDKMSALFSQEGTASFSDMKRLRTFIGQKISNPATLSGDELAALKQAYGALTEDMGNAAVSLGGDAARAAEKANRFYRVGSNAIETQIDPLIKVGQKTLDPQKVFDKLALGSRSQQQTLERQLRAFVPQQTQRNIGGVQLSQLGGENFSPAKFVSGLEKYRVGTGQLPSTMNNIPGVQDLETVARALNQAGSTVNRSNTSGANFLLSSLGGLGGAFTGSGSVESTLAGLAVSQGIPAVAAYAMQLPIVRQILSDTVSDSTAKMAKLMALGLNQPVASSLIESNYSTPGLLPQIGGRAQPQTGQ